MGDLIFFLKQTCDELNGIIHNDLKVLFLIKNNYPGKLSGLNHKHASCITDEV